MSATIHFDKKSHIWQARLGYIQPVKKIIAHIQRIVTMTTISTMINVSVSEDDLNALAIPQCDPVVDLAIPEGKKSEETKDDSIRDHSAQRKSGRRKRRPTASNV